MVSYGGGACRTADGRTARVWGIIVAHVGINVGSVWLPAGGAMLRTCNYLSSHIVVVRRIQ